jgi:hypothetical protein
MIKKVFPKSLEDDSMLLLDESLKDIDRIKKLNNVASVSIIEKPSLMARSSMKCMMSDLIDRQKHKKYMLHLSKKPMSHIPENIFTYSTIKRKPFTSFVKLKQPNKLRKHPKHEPISYCYQLKMLQNPREREFKLNEITLLENEINKLASWDIDQNVKRIIFDEKNEPNASSNKSEGVLNWKRDLILKNSEKVLELTKPINNELIKNDDYIDWDEINERIFK